MHDCQSSFYNRLTNFSKTGYLHYDASRASCQLANDVILLEAWSIFDSCNPGLTTSLKRFVILLNIHKRQPKTKMFSTFCKTRKKQQQKKNSLAPTLTNSLTPTQSLNPLANKLLRTTSTLNCLTNVARGKL